MEIKNVSPSEVLSKVLSEEDDILKGKVVKNKKHYEEYLVAIDATQKLSQKGLCTYYYRDPDIAYDTHIIEVLWNFKNTEDDIIEVSGKQLAKICKNMQAVTFDKMGDYWQLSIKIYKPE